MAQTASGVVKTYRYLRVSVVGLAVLLAVSVAIEWATGERGLGSISAYYYTPVRSVFVGALVGMGLALIAIKGRDRNYEDLLLNAAGMLAPVVAFVPTPLRDGQVVAGARVECPDDARNCVPVEFVPGIDNNVYALGGLAALGLAIAWWLARRDGRITTRSRVGLLLALGVVAGFLGLFLVAHDAFLVVAHYASAVPMFGALVVVVAINARHSARRIRVRRGEIPYARLYRTIWIGMTLALVGAGLYLLVLLLPGVSAWEGWIFVLEAVLLAFFSAFWILQTSEFYDEGLPREVLT